MRFDLPDPVDGRPPLFQDQLLLDVPIAVSPQAPRAAREVVAAALVEWMPAAIVERARLVVSELVTNSLLHSGAPAGEHVTVRLRALAPRCRIEVEDSGRGGAIAPRAPDPVLGGGMGLHLVAALSESWGVIRDGDGPSRVWAQLLDADGAGQD
jgi:anti-sigma regulatory factor (Ser/Thr protein kinase)